MHKRSPGEDNQFRICYIDLDIFRRPESHAFFREILVSDGGTYVKLMEQ